MVQGRYNNKNQGGQGKFRSKSKKGWVFLLSKKDHWKKDCSKLANSKEKQNSPTNVVCGGDEDFDIALISLSMTYHKDE